MSLKDNERHFASLNSYSVSESFASGRLTSVYRGKEEKLHYIPIWILGKGAFGECVWPPRACMTSLQRLGMLLMRWRMVS
uniref:Uncharacterized protein n=1 Tax=Salmo trutta TaxID=8032 RepID=A0A673X9Q6_SALTR